MKLRIIVAPEADDQADELNDWWSSNRPEARSLRAEIDRLFNLLARTPDIDGDHRGEARGRPSPEARLAELAPGTVGCENPYKSASGIPFRWVGEAAEDVRIVEVVNPAAPKSAWARGSGR